MKEKEDLNNENTINSLMGLSFWNRVLLGVSGGIFVTGSAWAFSLLKGDLKFLVVITIALGISAIFYARYAR